MKKSSSQPANRPGQKRSDSDRRVRQAARFASILRLLELIQSRGRWNVQSLADELECSQRTVHRYLQILEVAGVPYFFDESIKSYRVRSDFRFPLLSLSTEDAWAQSIASQFAAVPSAGISGDIPSVSRKIAAGSPADVQEILANADQLISILGLKLVDHSRHRECLKTAQWAHASRVVGNDTEALRSRKCSERREGSFRNSE